MRGPIVIVGGGEPPDPAISERLVGAALVIAADSGVDHARLLGLVPDVVVGDLDSASADGLVWAERHGADIQRHPVAKDATDLELALDIAQSAARPAGTTPVEVVVVDGGGGRLDHLVGNLALIAAPRPPLIVTALVGSAIVTPINEQRHLWGTVGEMVSLVAVGGRATGVTTTGLRWSLHDAMLEPFTSLGVSNQFAEREATVCVTDGTVLAIQPDPAVFTIP